MNVHNKKKYLSNLINTINKKNKNSIQKKNSNFSKIFNTILQNIRNKKQEQNKKIKLNDIKEKIKKINNYHNSYLNKKIELNQERIWIKILIQTRKNLIKSYEEIMNMQV